MAMPERRRTEMDAKKSTKGQDDLKGKTLRTEDLVRYQDGAVVSREVIRKPAGTVTAFAFDKGQQLSEHAAPFDALVIGLDGAADITIAGKVNPVEKGEMIIMPAGIPHALMAVSNFKMLLVMIKK
jgi:quercetin dioxygenase-like cupin family protein